VPAGEGRITDNLVCATLYFLEPALNGRGHQDQVAFDRESRSAAGEMTCAVSHGLAALIQEPGSWRIAALVGTARLLAPHVGLDAAAHLAASSARDYAKRVKAGLEAGLAQVGTLAAGAVESNDEALANRLGQLIADRLFIVPPVSVARRSV